MPADVDSENAALRRELALTELRAHLMGFGLDSMYARGLTADPATIAKLQFTDEGTAGADPRAVARALVATLPRHAFQREVLESPEDWAMRRFGGGTTRDATATARDDVSGSDATSATPGENASTAHMRRRYAMPTTPRGTDG